MTMLLSVHSAARSHIGRVRHRNEDAAYAGHHLFAVADGLGGHPAGDVASRVVIDALQPYDREVAAADLSDVMGQAVFAANSALRRRIATDPALAGMGSTLVALLQTQGMAVVANVGDSRAYRLRHAQIIQVSEDHTYGNLVADAGSIPNLAGRIARFLDGRADGRSPDLTVHELKAGDRYLLCSDGLFNVVALDLIEHTLSTTDDPVQAAEQLVTLANDHGGLDNITVVVIDAHDVPTLQRVGSSE